MAPQIRRVGIGLTAAFVAVFLWLNYVQIMAAESIASKPSNARRLLREYSIKRGDILTLDGQVIARSVRTGGRLKYRRTYPRGELYGHITGFYSIVYGKSAIERAYDDQLLGEGGVLSMQDIEDRFLGESKQGDRVRLTIHSRLQEAARRALGDQRGAVVALEPDTGEVRAMWSNPSYDPGRLASHRPRQIRRYWRSLNPGSPESPLVPIATSKSYPPGSTIKVVTAAAALENGFTPQSTFPDPQALDLPLTNRSLMNFTRTSCVGGGQIDLFTALVVSCDTTFGIIGLRIPDAVRETATSFGFNDTLPFDIRTEASVFPPIPDDQAPFRAYAAIGQGNVRATALQMALIAAGVANGGDVPRPTLVREIIDPTAGIVQRSSPETIGSALSAENAGELTEMMAAVVERGTGTAAQTEGTEVAGKTGTAQTGVEGESPHTWFIAFAPANDPELAVAVIVEHGGTFGSEATGGQVAAPIAKAVLEADRESRGW